MSRLERYSSQAIQRAFSILSQVYELDFGLTSQALSQNFSPIASTTRARLLESLNDTPFNLAQILEEVENDRDGEIAKSTILYLAYGSNLCSKTFEGVRGIRPLSQLNVLVPALDLTFDLPGIPYREPCFANTRYRSETDPANDYDWDKGLVGVVYEVSKVDYATIIATEGGGVAYEDIVVDCFKIPKRTQIVNAHPTSPPFKAHTLFAPFIPEPGPGEPPNRSGRVQRPDPSYAQASARYLQLLIDGAAEHDLPQEYQKFLRSLQPYTLTSRRQRIGKTIFISIWWPIMMFVFTLARFFADKKGKPPPWLASLLGIMFHTVWMSYDMGFKQVFGDGERTQEPKQDEKFLASGSRLEKGDHFDAKTPLMIKMSDLS